MNFSKNVFFLFCRFKTWRSLITHRRVTHTNQRFNCTHCDKSFRFKQSLKRHLERNVGTVAKPFSCEMCGKAYPSKSILKVFIFQIIPLNIEIEFET